MQLKKTHDVAMVLMQRAYGAIGEADPWKAKRCPNDVDPKPEDATQNACLTSGQIETLQMFFSRRMTDLKLANGRKDFGMWASTVSVANAAALEGAVAAAAPAGPPAGGPGGGSTSGGFLTGQRYRGREGASESSPSFNDQGPIGSHRRWQGGDHRTAGCQQRRPFRHAAELG